MVIKMKRIFPVILGLVVGLIFTVLFYKQYDAEFVFNEEKIVYVFQQGVYSSVDAIDKNVGALNYYVYEKSGDMYYVYAAFTTNEKNKDKLKGYFEDLGYSMYVKEISLNNTTFLESLEQYDLLMASIDDESAIGAINASVLGLYEEVYGGN